jgi:hypothetical protein
MNENMIARGINGENFRFPENQDEDDDNKKKKKSTKPSKVRKIAIGAAIATGISFNADKLQAQEIPPDVKDYKQIEQVDQKAEQADRDETLKEYLSSFNNKDLTLGPVRARPRHSCETIAIYYKGNHVNHIFSKGPTRFEQDEFVNAVGKIMDENRIPHDQDNQKNPETKSDHDAELENYLKEFNINGLQMGDVIYKNRKLCEQVGIYLDGKHLGDISSQGQTAFESDEFKNAIQKILTDNNISSNQIK